ncbi:HAD-IA family hydrolase [Streptomyces sp. NPDC060010]
MDRARAVVTAWSHLMPRVDQVVVALLKRARKAVTVALVSNATTQLDSDLARQGLDVLADAVVNTAHIGVAKPDPRVYLIAAERVWAPVHRCLFIDDTAADVTAAREVGMTALHYRGPEESPRRLLSAPRSPGSPERSIPNQLRGRATLGIFANPHQHPVAVFARRSRRRAARRPGRFRRCGRSVA